MMSKWMLLPAVGCLALAACNSAQDVPVPDDPQAQAWNTSIKTAYPGWQPTKEAPKGNAEYEAIFNAPQKAEQKVVVVEAAPVAVTEAPAAPEKVPAIYKDIPVQVRIDVAADGKFLADGKYMADDILADYLKKMAEAHKAQSVAIIHPQSTTVAPDRINAALEACRKAGIGKVAFVSANAKGIGKTTAAGEPRAAGKPRFEIDTTKPAGSYTVQPGDTLSRIAQKEYKNGAAWMVIYNANKATIKNPNKLSAGAKLVIPALKVSYK